MPAICFVVSLLLLAFGYGVAVAEYKIFPYQILKEGWGAARDWAASWRAYTRVEPVKHLAPARYHGNGVVVHDGTRAFPGVTLITSTWVRGEDWFNGFRLLAMDGSVLHEWRIAPEDVWSETPHDDIKAGRYFGRWRADIHGSVLLPNGDVIFNYEYLGLVRINACSQVVWSIPYRTHHSIFQDEQGTIWASGQRWREEAVPDFPGLVPPFAEEMILNVSTDGEILQEISVFEAFYRSGFEGLLFTRKRGGKDIKESSNDSDFLHLNDVEVLNANIAPAFKQFDAGDIMVSFRNINTVLVLDAATHKFKWSLTHPFIGQHDPDFAADGTIIVFDNRTGLLSGKPVFKGGRILKIAPSTKTISTLVPVDGKAEFFTNVRGKHQLLPNGNLLITEYEGGRVFEVTPKGDIVWSYINKWDEKRVAKISEGSRYKLDPAGFETSACKSAKDVLSKVS